MTEAVVHESLCHRPVAAWAQALIALLLVLLLPTAPAWAQDVSGTWNVTFKGNVRAVLTLQQSGNHVSGNLTTSDGTPGKLLGQVVGGTMTLQRDTGLETVQHYEVTVRGDVFEGTYHNTGRYPDRGAFVGQRQAQSTGVGGVWTVVFKGATSTTTTTLYLEQRGETVGGQLVPTDGSWPAVSGIFRGNELTLTRSTGLDTMQIYNVTVTGDAFEGRYRNEGKHPDEGSFTGRRQSVALDPSLDVSGVWDVLFKGSTATTLTLRQSGQRVIGNLMATDGSRGAVTGTLSDDVLTLTRDTGLETLQKYRVTVRGSTFTGSYVNEGRYPDQGSFTGKRR
jgi:hypothetical protein